MLAVVVFHSGLTYIFTELGTVWPFKDPYSKSLVFDVTMAYLTSITMPLFFTISGFMTGMLFSTRGSRQMVHNRLNRILYPLLMGLLILYPATIIAQKSFELALQGQTSLVLPALNQAVADRFDWQSFRPIHLWFLYYIVLFSITGSLTARLLKRRFPQLAAQANKAFAYVYLHRGAPVIFAAVTFVFLCLRRQHIIETPTGFAVNLVVFSTHALFFGFGWMLYYQRHHLPRFKNGASFCWFAGLILFFIKMIMVDTWGEKGQMVYLLAAVNAVVVWFLIFAYMGLFLKYANNYSRLGHYLARASYWIYLIHLPVVIVLQALFINSGFNVYAKFILVTTITFMVAISSYHFLVRNTGIGRFLNGRKA